MPKPIYLFVAACLLLVQAASAQRLNNDGFQRRNGQMHILRNGKTRPMLRDARLPTGAVVTKDGFVVGANGKRVELREGQGCDLKGNLVSVVSAGEGSLALRAPAQRQKSASPAVQEVRVVLEDLFGRSRQAEDRDDREEYNEKYEEKAREQRKKVEEWEREERKHQEEYSREREKKWKEKWKEEKKRGKKWDD